MVFCTAHTGGGKCMGLRAANQANHVPLYLPNSYKESRALARVVRRLRGVEEDLVSADEGGLNFSVC